MLDHVLLERNIYRQILEDAQKRYNEKLIEESKQVPEASNATE